ncbi:dolichyl-phosphate-mannose--protein mannosyltransferase [Nocardia donostiensis]|uniref:Polyprenol-phosphate-mannose--protein mannosyltransferase n=1 Tax=Nocardia donostiensis TaxID=1538463 RepID=A0A1W0BDH0_9NOCA|nr:phospholipid carrier-dependent glycosyltransferase [Nocardia donostiensis]ONM48310.1 dolichyl-phosphate-mannose--protein mannosyltransferase [Nocardia donostiensis]OQS14495.1 dolichyl-phosphate-mannose--protein mannosyltransferase [Nocardia donostiensis]OQS20579.1 dolichyl-phosphate-mannose--protein mannosyltransferase [Nocardia donostiensis]
MTQVTDQRSTVPARPLRSWSSPAPLRPSPDIGPTDTVRGWVVTLFLTAIAAVTRFTMLNYPTDAGTPVFDEKHYAPQAWQMLTGGGVEDNPGYGLVVHPPVGKQLIALGEALFGYNGWGWRFSAAVAGTLLVLLVIRIVRRMTRSTLLGAVAGILLIADGVMFVSSRIGMLDIFLALFGTAAFGCLIVDRDEVRARIAKADLEGRIGASPWGPRLGVRWWRFGAGVLLGLACGTKWSGLYFIAAFGLLSVFFDLAARRAYGVRKPVLGTALRDIVPALYALVLIPIGVYLASYAAWFSSETGVYRYMPGNPNAPEDKIGTGGFWSHIVPDALRSLWYFHSRTLEFHSELTNSAGNHHPWESKPWTWPMGLRPMLYYYADNGVTGCGQTTCVKAVMLVGTPAIWWVALPVLLWGLWRWVVRRDWRYASVLTAYGAALLPWFLALDRQMYYFYAVALAPFLVMALTLALGDLLGTARRTIARGPAATGTRTEPSERYSLGLLTVCLYLGLVIANFIWLWPILTALPITPGNWQDHLWLPSWR